MQAEYERLKTIFAVISEPCQYAIDVARSKGLLVGVGTDAGGNGLAPHDFSVAREMEALVDSGYSPMDVLTMATHHNSRILRWENDLGTLESGKLADFVILRADPLADVGNVRQVNAVYKGGVQV
jgi:imidazolonepropionase-like amidohydrolase